MGMVYSIALRAPPGPEAVYSRFGCFLETDTSTIGFHWSQLTGSRSLRTFWAYQRMIDVDCDPDIDMNGK